MKDSRTRNSIRNIEHALLNKTITLIVGLVSRKLFLQILTAEYLGINGLFANILTLLSFAELGFGNVMLYNMYKPMREGNIERIKSLLKLYKKAYIIIAGVISSVGLLLIPWLGQLVGETPDIKEDLVIIYVFFLLNASVSYLFSYKQTVLMSDQKVYIVSKYTSFFTVAKEIAQLIILYITRNYYLYLSVMLVSTILQNAAISLYVEKKYSWIKDTTITEIDKIEKNKIFKDVKTVAISRVAGISFNGTDSIIITKMLGVALVGLASNYTTIISSVSSIANWSLNGLVGSIGNLNSENDKEHQKSVFNQLFLLSYIIYSYICICIICLGDYFIRQVWLGEKYSLGILVCVSLVLITYQSGMNFPVYTFRTTYGLFSKMQWTYVSAAILNIFLSIVLGKIFGIVGVYFATTISKAVTSEIGDGYFTYRYGFKERPARYFVKYYLFFLLMVINCTITYFLSSLIPLSGIVGFIVAGIVCTIVSNLINFCVLSRLTEFKELKKRVVGIISNKFRME